MTKKHDLLKPFYICFTPYKYSLPSKNTVKSVKILTNLMRLYELYAYNLIPLIYIKVYTSQFSDHINRCIVVLKLNPVVKDNG